MTKRLTVDLEDELYKEFSKQSIDAEKTKSEVSKRCKNQWMRWTKEGLEALLQLRLVKYADPDHYREFLDELLHRSTKTTMNCDLSIESTRGKL